MSENVRELLAAYAHESWSGWMKYLFGKSIDLSSGVVVIPGKLVKRWKRQIATPYAELPEYEKESDRAEADKILEIVRSTLTQQEQEIARLTEDAIDLKGEIERLHEVRDALTEELAWSENAWKNAEAELRKNGIDGEGIVGALIFGFNMVYTSPAWGGDERTPEGWKKKEKAIRKAFTATIKKAITLFMVFLEFAKERVRVAEDCLDIKKKEVELLRAEVERLTRERDEWRGKAEEAVESMKYFERLHDKMQDAIGPLLGELSALRSEMKGMVRVDVLLRWMESRSRVLNRLGGAIMSRAGSNPGEQARAQMEWLTTVLTARQARGGGR